jgi:NAD(P)H-dependent FMN reductase
MSPFCPHGGALGARAFGRWSELVRSYDGFVFVFPQYNWGYPAVLKNALDFLHHEWADKPVGLVTYGSRGGGLAAAQLRQVLRGLHMRPTEKNVELKPDEAMLTGDDSSTTSTRRSLTISRR